MRNTFVLLLCLATFHLNAQFTDIDVLYRDSFPPHIRAVTLTSYLISYGENPEDTSLRKMSSRYTEYNKAGRLIVQENRFSNGEFSSDSTFYYTETKRVEIRKKSNLSSSTVNMAYNADGTLNSIFSDLHEGDDLSQEFRYNRKKQLLRLSETYAGQTKVVDYTYTKKGVLMKKRTSFQNAGDKKLYPADMETYTYDSAGRVSITLISYFAEDGSIRKNDTIWYSYDGAGHIVRMIESLQNGASRWTTMNEFDKAGRLIGQSKDFQSQTEGAYSYVIRIEYDQQGNCALFSETTLDSGSAVSWRTTYDENGLPLYCYYSNDAEVMFFTWTYVKW
jgi:hypothetical protein